MQALHWRKVALSLKIISCRSAPLPIISVLYTQNSRWFSLSLSTDYNFCKGRACTTNGVSELHIHLVLVFQLSTCSIGRLTRAMNLTFLNRSEIIIWQTWSSKLQQWPKMAASIGRFTTNFENYLCIGIIIVYWGFVL